MIDKALLNRAWKAVRPAVRWTPSLRSDYLDSELGARIFLKAECLQIGGSFKIRGASFRVSCLSPQQRSRGVVAFSSGNFAQGAGLVRSPGRRTGDDRDAPRRPAAQDRTDQTGGRDRGSHRPWGSQS
jgi:Pyridoxal-phosphate dependent enzyme